METNGLQSGLAGGFDLRPTGAGQGGQSRPAGRGEVPFDLRGALAGGLGFLNRCPAGFLRGADSGNPGSADLLPLRGGSGFSRSRSRSPKQLEEFLLKSVNALFDICGPT